MESVRCNLCGGEEGQPRFPNTINGFEEEIESDGTHAFRCTHSGYGRHHAIVECRNCSLVYTNPRPHAQEILDSYFTVEDELYQQERDGRLLTFERHIGPLEKLKKPPGRLLDVGAYTGIFVEVAGNHGWDAWGIEPSRWALAQARARGLQMIEGTLDSGGLPDASFDVVTMWDVIEHVSDPLSVLEQAHRLLGPGGIVVVHTMNLDSLFARLLGGKWPWLMEMHIYYFSRRTLRAMLEKAGFAVLEIQTQGRFVRFTYLATRIGALLGAPIGRALGGLAKAAGVGAMPVPINLGDLMTAFAVKR
jgi:2-polyprenyl-3-methyl-5-hydroxy-6-metoxy-1,4-benzoquinol methylase